MAVLKLVTDDILGTLVIAYILSHITYTLWLSFSHGYIAAWLQKAAKKYNEWRIPKWHGRLAASGLYHAVIYNEQQFAAKKDRPWYDNDEDANDLTAEHFDKRYSLVHGRHAKEPLPESAFPKVSFVESVEDHLKNWFSREIQKQVTDEKRSGDVRCGTSDYIIESAINKSDRTTSLNKPNTPQRQNYTMYIQPRDKITREMQIQEMQKELNAPNARRDELFNEAAQTFIQKHAMKNIF